MRRDQIKDKPDRERALSASEQRYRTIVETMGDGLSEINEHRVTTYANDTLCRMWGRRREEIIGKTVDGFLDKKNLEILNSQFAKRKKGESEPYEIVWTRKDGTKLHTIMTPTPYFDKNGNFKGSFAVITDISKQKKERSLLEIMVKQRTRELEDKKNSLEEINTALKVLLKTREEDKQNLEQRMMINVKELVLPYLEKIGQSPLNKRQENYVEIMASALNDIISPFMHHLSLELANLTPSEIQVAKLIKFGKTTKEIAEMLNLSDKTIEFHRKRIRKKIGITNKKINLHTYLASIK